MKNPGNKYHWQGVLVSSILGIAGALILVFTGFLNIKNYDELYNYVYKDGLVAIISLFFIGVSIYILISYVVNVLIKPKKTILYLLKIEDEVSEFIDIKGKKYFFYSDKFKKNKFYYVMKTRNYIHEILNESYEIFSIPKEKRSYWMNCYLPVGNFENLFLLPIVYIILLPGLLSLLMAKGFDKIYGAIWCLVPVYAIIYDLVYKIKLKKNNYKEIDDSAFEASYIGLQISIKLIAVVVINIIVFYLFIKSDGLINKLITSPFCLCAICCLGQIISSLLENEHATKFFLKGYISIFLLYIFIILVYAIIEIIIAEEYLMLLFTVPFWAVWIYVLYKAFICKEEN